MRKLQVPQSPVDPPGEMAGPTQAAPTRASSSGVGEVTCRLVEEGP